MRTIWLAAACLLAGCASVPVRPAVPVVDLNAADARVLQGCYDCLREARDAYARAAVGRVRPLIVPRLFEAELLMALRDKEFAFDPAPALARARALGPELPPAIDVERYLALVDAVPYESAGWTRAEGAAFRAAHSAFLKRVDDDLSWLSTDVLTPAVAEYLGRALDCGYSARLTTPARVKFDAPSATAAPLVRYRAAACMPGVADPFERLRVDVPQFVDVSYYLGAIATASLAEGGPDPRPLVDAARQMLPDSPSVTFLAATTQQTFGNCEDALPIFDRLIAMKPAHERGWLGRVVCLTSLEHTADAIAAAARMIELGLDNIDEAWYWRARNYHTLKQLDLARVDIDAAKQRRVSSPILTLAGIIEHDQDDLDVAEADLKRARQMDGGRNCVAEWFLGSVLVKRSAWAGAAAAFDAARGCYERDAQTRELRAVRLEANEKVEPEFRRRQVESIRSEAKGARQQQFASAFNAANFFYQSGDIEKARELLDIAELDPNLSTEVASLRPLVPKVPASRTSAEP